VETFKSAALKGWDKQAKNEIPRSVWKETG